jgi:putative ATPase
LTWEALRQAPEGGVWSLATTAAEAAALRELAARLPELERPVVLEGVPADLTELLAFRGEGDLRFDAVLGRSILAPRAGAARPPDRSQVARRLAGLLSSGGVISLAEPVPRHAQRLHALVDWRGLGEALADRVRAAEEAIYTAADDPLVNWDADDLRAIFAAAGLGDVRVEGVETMADARITPALLARWFSPAAGGERPSYAQRLAPYLDADALAAVRALYERSLTNQTVPWRSVMAYLSARKGPG